jgi:hypothetical protein
MKITPDVFEAYLKCPTKCWLRATDEPSAGATYPEWVKAQNHSYRVSETRRLVAESPDDEVVISPDIKNFKAAKWRLASNLAVQAQMDSCALESELHALERVPAEGPGQASPVHPYSLRIHQQAGERRQAALLMAWSSRPCDRSMWLPGLRTFQGPNRPLSKSSPRFGCRTIFWSFGKSHH